MAQTAELEYRTLRCPIEDCEWILSVPYASAMPKIAEVMAAAELLAHLTSRRIEPGETGYPQERLHDLRALGELGLEGILDAAGVTWMHAR